MSDGNQYSWFSLFKKIIEFLKYLVSFFRNRKKVEEQKQKEKFDEVVVETKKTYDEIDKEKQLKEQDDINKRLKNLF